jgi:rod shape-determining protein MreC
VFRNSRKLRIVLALLILTSFTLITIDYRSGRGSPLHRLRDAASSVFGPIQRAVTSVVRPVGNALSTVGELGSIRHERDQLRGELKKAQEQLHSVDDVLRENDELRRLYDLAARGQYRIVAARVIGDSAAPFEWTVQIDAGSRDGVRKGMTVVNGDGLVGRVLSASPWSSSVLLANDPTFRVKARMAVTGEIGLLGGNALDPMELELQNADAKVGKSEPVVTSALSTGDGIIAGVPVGVAKASNRVRNSVTKSVFVQPFVNYARIDHVGVVVAPPRSDPRNAVLPTPPASASATPAPGSSSPPGPSPGPSTSGSPAVEPTTTTTPTRP